MTTEPETTNNTIPTKESSIHSPSKLLSPIKSGALSDTPNLTPSTPNFQRETSNKVRKCIRTELLAQPTPEYLAQLPNIEKLLLILEGKGKSKSTLIAYEKNLKYLARRADLSKPEQVELAIARYMKKDGHPASNNYKSKLCDHYDAYCKKISSIAWEKPIYTPEDKAISPPSTERVSMFVASARNELSIRIDVMQQTGYRPCEIQGEKGISVRDLHPDTNTIVARIHKGCNARPPQKVSEELMARLMDYVHRKNLTGDDILF